MCVNRIRRCCVILLKCVHPPTVERERRVEGREEERKELIALGRRRGFYSFLWYRVPAGRSRIM